MTLPIERRRIGEDLRFPMQTILCLSTFDQAPRASDWISDLEEDEWRILELQPDSGGAFDPARLDGYLSQAGAIVFQGASFQSEWIRKADRCGLIVHADSGSGGVDLESARNAGIYVASVPDAATDEYASMTMDALGRPWGDPPRVGGKIRRREARLGVIGMGQVGRAVADRARTLGYVVWGCDPFVKQEVFVARKVHRASLTDLLGICDTVTLHLHANMIGLPMLRAHDFALMRKGSVLINTSSLALINMPDLLSGLALDKPAAAALVKPDPSDGPLLAHDRIHWLEVDFVDSPEIRSRRLRQGCEMASQYFSGQVPTHLLIDPPLPRVLVDAG